MCGKVKWKLYKLVEHYKKKGSEINFNLMQECAQRIQRENSHKFSAKFPFLMA